MFVNDVMLEMQRGGMCGVCVEPAGAGSLDRIVRALRELPETLRPYLIVLDEKADDATANQYLHLGADDVIRDSPGTGVLNCTSGLPRVFCGSRTHSAAMPCTIH